MKVLFSALVFNLVFIQTSISAQDITNVDTKPTDIAEVAVDWAHFENELQQNESWSFYKNKKGDILYIDFENLGEKMERLELVSDKNGLIKADNELFDLPINTIYELNLEKLNRGTYIVKLYTFEDNIIQQQITIE